MAGFLLIESSTKTCSVGIAVDGQLVEVKEKTSEAYVHAELLHVFIEEVFRKAQLDWTDIDAVCVAKGPGSYTGLRIGVSAAKGFCYGANKKLLAISTVQCLANKAIQEHPGYDFYIPMLDARRMEVYTQVYNGNAEPLEDIEALVLNEDAYSDYRNQGSCLFFGDGSEKFKPFITEDLSQVETVVPGVSGMVKDSADKFVRNEFEDVAYFEPLYLKSFVAGKKGG